MYSKNDVSDCPSESNVALFTITIKVIIIIFLTKFGRTFALIQSSRMIIVFYLILSQLKKKNCHLQIFFSKVKGR